MLIDARRLVRVASAAGMLGGLSWTIGTALHASRPVGCVAEQCGSTPMRQTSTLEGILVLGGLLLIGTAAAALVARARDAGRFGKAGVTGASLALTGVASLVVAMLVQAVFFAGDFGPMPYFVVPGVLALVAGVVLLAITVLRSAILPWWAATALVVGAVAMLAFNEQTAAAWLGIPFGVAWTAAGYALSDA